jgi:hypothetical protein
LVFCEPSIKPLIFKLMRMLLGALWFVSDAPLAAVDAAVLRDRRYWIRNAEIVEREKAC